MRQPHQQFLIKLNVQTMIELIVWKQTNTNFSSLHFLCLSYQQVARVLQVSSVLQMLPCVVLEGSLVHFSMILEINKTNQKPRGRGGPGAGGGGGEEEELTRTWVVLVLADLELHQLIALLQEVLGLLPRAAVQPHVINGQQLVAWLQGPCPVGGEKNQASPRGGVARPWIKTL